MKKIIITVIVIILIGIIAYINRSEYQDCLDSGMSETECQAELGF